MVGIDGRYRKRDGNESVIAGGTLFNVKTKSRFDVGVSLRIASWVLGSGVGAPMPGQGRRGRKRIDGSKYPGKDGVLEMIINWVSRAPRVEKWLQKEKRKRCRERDEERWVAPLSSQRLSGC